MGSREKWLCISYTLASQGPGSHAPSHLGCDASPGYPRKAGHVMISRTESDLVFSPPRLRQGLDMREHGCKEIRKRPPEKARRGRRAIRRATIEVMQDGPHLGAPLGQATMMVVHLRPRAVASFDRRRGPLQGVDPVGRPRMPSRKDCGSQSLGEGMLGTCGSHGFPCRRHLGCASTTTGASSLAVPRDHGQEALVDPLQPPARQDTWLQILAHTLPPEIDEGSQGR